jgi:hypothetical protein
MKRTLLILALFLLALLVGGGALQAQGGYDLSWWTVDGGGTTSASDGSYTLGGTAGQPDAWGLSNGSYTLGGGFWGGGAVTEAGLEVYLPVIMK